MQILQLLAYNLLLFKCFVINLVLHSDQLLLLFDLLVLVNLVDDVLLKQLQVRAYHRICLCDIRCSKSVACFG